MEQLRVEKKGFKKLLWRNGFMKELRVGKNFERLLWRNGFMKELQVEKKASKIDLEKWLHETAAGEMAS